MKQQHIRTCEIVRNNSTTVIIMAKEFEEFGEGSFLGKGNLKLTSKQEKIHELEKRLRDAELE